MNSDLYSILGINRSSSQIEIKKKYKKLAMKWHPDRNINDQDEANKKFKEISYAYKILSDPQKRKHYDFYGNNDYMSSNNFDFFKNMFQDNFQGETVKHNFFKFFDQNIKTFHKKHKNKIFRNLLVDLEDCYYGSQKSIQITRINKYNKKESNIIHFNIKPGYKSGVKFIFDNHGNFDNNQNYDDLILILKIKKHPRFERSNNDIIYHRKLNLSAILNEEIITIQTINKEIIKYKLYFDKIKKNNYKIIFKNKGMPIKNSQKFGNFIVYFSINYES